jgi:hypothetical protein
MPCDYKQYPDNWKWLSKQVIKDANNKCELCYAPNKGVIVRNRNTGLYPWTFPMVIDEHNIDSKLTLIVLTVHHINHDKKDNSKQNLIALCQKCHLRLDLAHHMKTRRLSKQLLSQNVLL